MPGARQRRDGEFLRRRLPASFLFRRQRRRIRGFRRQFEARRQMRELGHFNQRLRRIGAAIILILKQSDGGRDIAGHRRFE